MRPCIIAKAAAPNPTAPTPLTTTLDADRAVVASSAPPPTVNHIVAGT